MISCIISTYNRAENFLPGAIDSVMRQTIDDWELIVVDDCSTDNTKEVVEHFMEQDKRIKYKRLSKNSGSDTKPKNTGARMSKGEYLMYLDDDVTLRKSAFKLLSNILDTNKNIDVAYGDMWIVPKNEPGVAYDFDVQLLMVRNFIDTSAAMMRREALFEVGGWDEKLNKFVDWNLWVRMAKTGKRFQRLQEFTFDYFLHQDSKSGRIETPMYLHEELGMIHTPTFDPSGCPINVGHLRKRFDPKVAIFTIHYDRPEYSIDTYKSMIKTAGYEFDWFCADNSKGVETSNALHDKAVLYMHYSSNQGITKSSNNLITEILSKDKYDIIIKIDNDVEFQTVNWLADIVEMWKSNHMIYVSPYVEGLYHNPGGAPRVGYGKVGSEFVEVTKHIGGIFAAISAKAYEDFRWQDEALHGNQDREASEAFRLKGYMPCYYPKHRIMHRDSTLGQQDKLKDYFERRKKEKYESAK